MFHIEMMCGAMIAKLMMNRYFNHCVIVEAINGKMLQIHAFTIAITLDDRVLIIGFTIGGKLGGKQTAEPRLDTVRHVRMKSPLDSNLIGGGILDRGPFLISVALSETPLFLVAARRPPPGKN